MLHNEARELLVEGYEATHDAKGIAKAYSVSKWMVYRLAEQKRKTGSVALRTSQRGRKPILTTEDKEAIRRCIDEAPDITIEEIRKGCKIIKKGEVYGPYLATKKVGKNNPKAEEIKADNEIRMEWNRAVDRAIVSGVPEEEILELKKTEITDRVKESVEQNGKKPELFAQHFIIFSRVRLFLKQ